MKLKNKEKLKRSKLARRKRRVRARVSGTSARPRLSVFRSAKHIYAQIIDDVSGITLVSARDIELGNKFEAGERKGKVARAYAVGKLLADRGGKAGVKAVVFDRGGRTYHGRVQALADGAREGGLKF